MGDTPLYTPVPDSDNTQLSEASFSCATMMPHTSWPKAALFVAISVVGYTGQAWGIYYIFFWKNKHMYDLTNNVRERLGSLFDPRRSLIVVS